MPALEVTHVYLLLLDRDGKCVDNHSTGVDRVYLGRREDGRVELYAVSCEREAVVAHWTLDAAGAVTRAGSRSFHVAGS
jgi:hypothetical protein